MLGMAQFCVGKPRRRKFLYTISHVFASKHAKRKHLFRCELRFEIWIEVFPYGFGKGICIVFLHEVVYYDDFRLHRRFGGRGKKTLVRFL